MLVRSLADFARHVTAHRRRVYMLALLADPELAKHWQARALLRLHDVGKYLLLRALWRFYGGKGDRVAARALYDRLNALDDAIAAPMRALTPPALAERVAHAERIADCVDRNCDPVAREEFAAPAGPLSDYLDGPRFDRGQQIALAYPLFVHFHRLAYRARLPRSE